MARGSSPVACLAGLGVLAAFYMLISVRGAATSTTGGKREVSLFGRYEKLKLTSENDALKEKIRALTAKLEQGDAAAAAKAAATAAAAVSAAPTPLSSAKAAQVGGGSSALRSSSSSSSSSDGSKSRTGSSSRSSSSSSAGLGAPAQPFGDRRDYRLTKELIRSRCNAHNIILVTFVNSKRADYGYTWAAHVNRLNLTNYLVGAMDGEALKKLNARNIPSFDMESGLTTADYGWGTKNFRQLGLRKTELIITLVCARLPVAALSADASRLHLARARSLAHPPFLRLPTLTPRRSVSPSPLLSLSLSLSLSLCASLPSLSCAPAPTRC